MHVYLTGFMGAGKSTVGRHLAEILGWPFVDLDEMIARQAGESVAEIFQRSGEAEFRRLEAAALRSLDEIERVVVATGGGVMTSNENRDWMQQRGLSVWLDVPLTVLTDRLRAGPPGARPLFISDAQAGELYARRRADYRKSDIRIPVEPGWPPRRVAESIHGKLTGARCGT